MSINWKNWLNGSFLLIGIFGLYFILKEQSLKEILNTYKNANITILILYILAVLSILLLLNWRWNCILQSRKIYVPFRKLFIYRIIGISINFLTPGPRVGGEPTQATMLTRHKIDFTEGLSTIMIDKIIDITTSGVLFLIGLSLVGLKYSIAGKFGLILLICGLIFIILIVLFYYRMLNSKHFFLKIFHMLKIYNIKSKTLVKIERKLEEIEGMMIEFYKNNKKSFIKALTISVLSWVAMFFEYKFAAQLLGYNIGVIEIFFIVSFVGMAMLFPIPMAIGVLEAGQISAFTLLGLPINAGIALAFLVRAKDILISIIGVLLLTFYGFHAPKVVKKKYISKAEQLDDGLKIKKVSKNK
ncbi:MAG: hypothetical protein KatS3mg002_0072 [Candidatus Woesearchaeota archaeon]|nr:MAG: hypothetical protein KatS3mg002_0072 [Candidatus Woesearchaeota archaeon]